MPSILKLRRGTTTEHASFTGEEGELTADTIKDCVVLHDGLTQGGFEVAMSSELDSYISLSALDTELQASTDFADFKSRIQTLAGG
tara:strand:+ start:558 stop:815 length:258 start_codon:yes stop_codon:yes gene_type:complete